MNRAPIELAFERMTWLRDHPQFSKKFDIDHWANKPESHPLDQPETPDCGFSGCFMGWASHQRWFDHWGLRLDLEDFAPGTGVMSGVVEQKNIFPVVRPDSAPAFRRYVNAKPGRQSDAAIDAVAKLFGIHRDTLGMIIYEENYRHQEVTPEMVRDRLGELLEHGEQKFQDLVIEANEAADEERR